MVSALLSLTFISHERQMMRHVYETRFQTGDNPRTFFEAVGEAGCHYRQLKITSTSDAIRVCRETLGEYFSTRKNQEEFLVISLNTKYCPIRIVRITRGTLDASLVHPREVFRPAIVDCAAALLLVHNHPSGDPTPSREDRSVTDTLTQVGKLVGISVLDHIVVGDPDCLSIREYF